MAVVPVSSRISLVMAKPECVYLVTECAGSVVAAAWALRDRNGIWVPEGL
jgi:hypothetical protein